MKLFCTMIILISAAWTSSAQAKLYVKNCNYYVTTQSLIENSRAYYDNRFELKQDEPGLYRGHVNVRHLGNVDLKVSVKGAEIKFQAKVENGGGVLVSRDATIRVTADKSMPRLYQFTSRPPGVIKKQKVSVERYEFSCLVDGKLTADDLRETPPPAAVKKARTSARSQPNRVRPVR